MIEVVSQKPRRLTKGLPAVVVALFMAGLAIPAWAESDRAPGPEGRAPAFAASDSKPNGDLPLAHKVKLALPPALIGDGTAATPKLSFELGYGKPTQSSLGGASHGNLPAEFWGPRDQLGIKASVTMGF